MCKDFFKGLKGNKTRWAILLLSIWLVVSLVYIGWQVVNRFQVDQFWQGYGVAVSDLMDRAEAEDCSPFPVFMEDRQVYLINIACLDEEVLEGLEWSDGLPIDELPTNEEIEGDWTE